MFGSPKKVLVMGSGFVSRPLVDYLLERDSNHVTLASAQVEHAQNIVEPYPESGTAVYLDAADQGIFLAITISIPIAISIAIFIPPFSSPPPFLPHSLPHLHLHPHPHSPFPIPTRLNLSASVGDLIKDHDVVVSLLPTPFHLGVSKACVGLGKSMITASYETLQMKELHQEAQEKDVILMNEVGLDPGLDHMFVLYHRSYHCHQSNHFHPHPISSPSHPRPHPHPHPHPHSLSIL